MSARDYVLDIPCAYCGAAIGRRCRTKTGWATSYSHGARSGALYRAWVDGFTEGQRDILSAFESENHGYFNARRAEYRKEQGR